MYVPHLRPLARRADLPSRVVAQDLAFLVSGKPAFTLPLSSISNTSITKSEVTLEFTSAQPPPPVDEDALARKKRIRATGDEVSEIRFYVPGTANSLKKKGEKAARVAKVKAEGGDDAKAEEEEDEESDEDSADEGGETAAQVFHDSVKDKADIGLVVGESFCTIQEVLCLTPRGRFGASPISSRIAATDGARWGRHRHARRFPSSQGKDVRLPNRLLADPEAVPPPQARRCALSVCRQHRPSDPTGSDEVPLPRHAVCQGRDDGVGSEPRRVSVPFLSRMVAGD
jgi:hypothetical protein